MSEYPKETKQLWSRRGSTVLRERRKELGMVRVEVWVGEEQRDRLLKYAKRLRKEAGLP